MKISILAFTDRGYDLAIRIADLLPAQAHSCIAERIGRPLPLAPWTKNAFTESDGIIYVGAVGIAVRAVAPFVTSKDRDPAVVVVDEGGNYAIPILSGHLGGANDLARSIEGAIGAKAVITTATDVNGVFAVDEWARKQNMALIEKERIVKISGALLAGERIVVGTKWEISGTAPKNVAMAVSEEDMNNDGSDVEVDVFRGSEEALHLVPRIVCIGIGCRRGTASETIHEVFDEFLLSSGLYREAITDVASIDLKKDEEGLIAFCRESGWNFSTFTAEELMGVNGDFESSDFVREKTGADNVCERSAVKASSGSLIIGRFARAGVTIAAAARDFNPDWQW